MTQQKPVKTLELQVDVDTPLEAAWKAVTEGPGLANWFAPIAEVSAPGMGATVKNGWSAEMMMTATVTEWEPLKHVRWLDESGWIGPGTSMAVDFHLSTENGVTRVRLVQSAFGASEGWDDLFDGTEVGWTYFLYNLKAYLERHVGRTRRMISERLPVKMARHAFWQRLLSPAGGLASTDAATTREGDVIRVRLDGAPQEAKVEVLVEDRALGLRLPGLVDTLLFIEFEGKSDDFHVGWWLSAYDEAVAKRIEAPARETFRRVHEALPRG